MCSPLSVSIVIKVRLRNKEKQRSLEAKKQITSNIKEAGSLESVFSLFLNDGGMNIYVRYFMARGWQDNSSCNFHNSFDPSFSSQMRILHICTASFHFSCFFFQGLFSIFGLFVCQPDHAIHEDQRNRKEGPGWPIIIGFTLVFLATYPLHMYVSGGVTNAVFC